MLEITMLEIVLYVLYFMALIALPLVGCIINDFGNDI